jgi:hypothetical protein
MRGPKAAPVCPTVVESPKAFPLAPCGEREAISAFTEGMVPPRKSPPEARRMRSSKGVRTND